MYKIRNLGRVLSTLAKQEVYEIIMHDDVYAHGAPSECHALVSKGVEKRKRVARKLAEAQAGAPFRIIRREAAQRGGIHINSAVTGCQYGRGWERLVGVLDDRLNPFKGYH